MRLKDKVAIITGGSSGIGEAASILFAEEGAQVAVVGYKHVTEGNNIVKAIMKNGGKAIFVKADVSNEEDVKSIVEETVKTFGGIDVVFSNAAILMCKNVTSTSAQEWDQLMRVNLRSAFLLCKYTIPVIKERGGGSIVIDASIDGVYVPPEEAAYITSKAGLIALTKSMSVDYGRDNIRVNCVVPGWVETPMNKEYFAEPGNREKAGKLHSLGRIGKPREIAYAALFLASDEASFITGCSLIVDGGITAGYPQLF
jgi:NAD(P)-dependent dehydrogenase (short-subunit alcohol dehydrogenase family)